MNLPAARPHAPKPSIVRGFRCLVQGLRHARSTPGLKGAYGHYALALVVVSLVLGALFVLGAQHGVEWLSIRYAAHLPDDESLRHVLEVLAIVIATVLALVLAPVTGLFVVGAAFPLLGERLFYAGLRHMHPARADLLKPAPSDGLVRSLALGGRRFARVLAYQVLGFCVSFIPGVGIVLGPLISIGGSGWIVGWEMLDPYLSRLSLPIHQQRAVAKAYRRHLIGFGAPAVAIMSVPLLGPLFFPLIQVAAARLVEQIFPTDQGACTLVGAPVPAALQVSSPT
jgi:uncharacterized protein involved in cysteine biosynthesis